MLQPTTVSTHKNTEVKGPQSSFIFPCVILIALIWCSIDLTRFPDHYGRILGQSWSDYFHLPLLPLEFRTIQEADSGMIQEMEISGWLL